MMLHMRTTVTLDADVAAALQAVQAERGISFKQALNDALRAGLSGSGSRPKPYRLRPRRLGLRAGVDLDKALTLASEVDDAEVIRKLELRK